MDDGSMTLIIALVFLVACSAFFSASETAFSSLNQIRLKSRAEDGDASAARVLAMAEKYDKLLSTILIGNNIVNIAAASIGTIIFTKMLGAERGATVSTMVLTVVVLIFGEVTPKSLAKEMPETIATAVSPVLNLLLSVATYFTAGRQAKNNEDSAAMARIVCERYLRNGCITGVFLNVINVYFMYSAITGTGFGFGF